MSQWSVEVTSWERLKHDRQREFLSLAGNAGGEWWGDGRILLSAYPQAHRLSASARARGFFVQMKPSDYDRYSSGQ
jgi:hypothetical protein